MNANTLGRYCVATSGWTISPMDATIHTLVASHHIQDRIGEATAARSAKAVKPRRWFVRKSKRDSAADLTLPVTTKWTTLTPS